MSDGSGKLIGMLFAFLWNKIKSLFPKSEAATRDPFLERQRRATLVGALSGLAGTAIALAAGGFFLEGMYYTFCDAVDADVLYGLLIGCLLTCSPVSLVGIVAGAIAGRRSVKRDDEFEYAIGALPPGMVSGGVAGLVIGILPYTIELVDNAVKHGHFFC